VTESKSISVVIADDSVLLREGMARLLVESGFDVVGQAGDAPTLVRLVRETRPSVAIVDIRMPPGHTDEGLRAAKAIRQEHRDRVAVLVLSQYLETAFALGLVTEGEGGLGYLLKDRVADVDDFAEAVRRVARGGLVIDPDVVARLVGRRREPGPVDELSDRELEVLSLMAEGRSNQAIGDHLYVTQKTVEAHIAHIFAKLGLLPATDDHRRVLAVLAYLRAGTIPVHERHMGSLEKTFGDL
jgi:serine/threonine-protein kinase